MPPNALPARSVAPVVTVAVYVVMPVSSTVGEKVAALALAT